MGDVEIEAPAGHDYGAGDAVWCCVGPEHVVLDGGDGAIHGRVTAGNFGGDGYALTVEPDGAGDALEGWLPSSRSKSLPGAGDHVAVRIPTEVIHLLPR